MFVRLFPAIRWSSDLVEVWEYRYADFGEGSGRSPRPVLRAVVDVSTPGAVTTFEAIIDTGGPITIVARSVLALGGDPADTGDSMVLRIAGSTNKVPLYEVTLEVRPPDSSRLQQPIAWRGVVAVLDPWPHRGTAVLLGQSGFLDAFTVTFGSDGFVLEPASVFRQRFPTN